MILSLTSLPFLQIALKQSNREQVVPQYLAKCIRNDELHNNPHEFIIL